ncbi:hypothetical protein [Fodinicola feengrottensis]|uniref:hypothetical protein n=1 Tax=Fodinicola feengrottensis TaxID=435914 RepID=UPI0013D18169|nr:hypothetical protein [Fodinicola feengrottensis]
MNAAAQQNVPAPDPDAGRPILPDGLFAELRADPLHAPEHLALEAVRRTGPEARDWFARARSGRTTPRWLAKRVRDRFTRLSRYSGAAGGVLGLPGAVADVGVLAWNQARMIIFLSAVYELDPCDRERAAEILVLTGVHEAMSLAETAVRVAARRTPATDLLAHGGGGSTWDVARRLADGRPQAGQTRPPAGRTRPFGTARRDGQRALDQAACPQNDRDVRAAPGQRTYGDRTRTQLKLGLWTTDQMPVLPISYVPWWAPTQRAGGGTWV